MPTATVTAQTASTTGAVVEKLNKGDHSTLTREQANGWLEVDTTAKRLCVDAKYATEN